VFQQFNLLARTSAAENVELPLMYTDIPTHERHERAMKALLPVGLAEANWLPDAASIRRRPPPAWRLQALAEGDLSERTRERALRLAQDADLRLRAPQSSGWQPGTEAAPGWHRDSRLPVPGTVIWVFMSRPPKICWNLGS
jgi:hypothetical protein